MGLNSLCWIHGSHFRRDYIFRLNEFASALHIEIAASRQAVYCMIPTLSCYTNFRHKIFVSVHNKIRGAFITGDFTNILFSILGLSPHNIALDRLIWASLMMPNYHKHRKTFKC